MDNTITAKEFDNAFKGIDWIKENILHSDVERVKNGKFYFYFSYDDVAKVITAENSVDKADFAVYARFVDFYGQEFDNKNECFVSRIAEIHDMEYMSFGEYLYKQDIDLDVMSESEEKALYNKYVDCCVDGIMKNFEIADFENHKLFAQEFDLVCESLYFAIIKELENKFDSPFSERN